MMPTPTSRHVVTNTGELALLSSWEAWFGLIMFAVQIYFDFSGYSDMAIGLGRMFGFHFRENFNYPYISKSIHPLLSAADTSFPSHVHLILRTHIKLSPAWLICMIYINLKNRWTLFQLMVSPCVPILCLCFLWKASSRIMFYVEVKCLGTIW